MQPTVPIAFEALLWVFVLGSVGMWIEIFRRLLRRQPLVPYEAHLPVPWSGWDVILLVCVALSLEGAALRSSMRGTETDPSELSAASVAVASAAHLIWLAFAVVFLSAKVGARFGDLGFDVRKLGSDLRLGGMAFLAAVLPVNGLQRLLTELLMPSEHPLQKLAKERPSISVLALATVAAVVVAPIFEEFVFRVVLQGWLEKQEIFWRQRTGATGPVSAGFMPIVVVSAIFGALHWGHGPDPAALFVLGLFLGYAYQRTHRIFAPLVVHVCFNALAILQLWVTLG